MNTKEIDKILRKNIYTRKFYVGCFPSDKIPSSNTFPCCMVVNTDTSVGEGEHWVAIFAESKERVEYYDSFGIWPPVENIAAYLSAFGSVQHCNVPLQSELSSACGKHVIYFLIHRCKAAEPYQEIIKRLYANRTTPDRIVNSYVRTLMEESV